MATAKKPNEIKQKNQRLSLKFFGKRELNIKGYTTQSYCETC